MTLEEIERGLGEAERALSEILAGRRGLSQKELLGALRMYQRACRLHGYLATFYPGLPLEKRSLRLVNQGRRAIYGNRLAAEQESFFARVPKEFVSILPYSIIAIALALMSALVVALLVQLNPELGWKFLDEDTAQRLSKGELWTEKIRGMSALASTGIMKNNITVSFTAFALGITGGIGTLVLLVINGAQLGGLFSLLSHYHMAHRLLDFVVAHGVLELSIIFVCAGAGLALGDSLLHPGRRTRREALREIAGPALDVVLFSALCLVVAGFVEGYVSPYEEIRFGVKLGLGLTLGALYWIYLLWPLLRPRTQGRV